MIIIINEHYSHKLIDVYQCREIYKQSDPAKKIKKGQIDIEETYKKYSKNI